MKKYRRAFLWIVVSALALSTFSLPTSYAANKAQLFKPSKAGRISTVVANTILSGVTPPKPSDGINGDFYIDTKSMFFYGPKIKSHWPSPTSLRGPQGQSGANGSNGTDAKQSANVVAAGAQGLTGSTGTKGEQGAQGVGGLAGPKGETGVAGAAGAVDFRENAARCVEYFLMWTLRDVKRFRGGLLRFRCSVHSKFFVLRAILQRHIRFEQTIDELFFLHLGTARAHAENQGEGEKRQRAHKATVTKARLPCKGNTRPRRRVSAPVRRAGDSRPAAERPRRRGYRKPRRAGRSNGDWNLFGCR